MMVRSDLLARLFFLSLLIGISLAIGFALFFDHAGAVQVIARLPEMGGWDPGNLQATVGEPLRLRVVSDDVVHGFALGQSDLPETILKPGILQEITLTFDKPGSYTYYCTRWCGPNHWRMRGVIEVTGTQSHEEMPPPPLYLALGLDIDATLHADQVPQQRPSALAGETLASQLSQDWKARMIDTDYYRAHSPEQVWKDLRVDPALSSLSDQSIWDLVAYMWRQQIELNELTQAAQRYAANCAACHGEEGAGDGVFSDQISADPQMQAMPAHISGAPTDFTDAQTLLAASPARLHGKIIRGGMGTGMPYWGPIFTDEQVWELVAYLWTFQFDMDVQP